MIREIVKIDEEKCNGCGECIINCPEGALQIIDGKARIVSEISCDGLGACIGHCPLGAISIEEREADQYDELDVMERIVTSGEATIKAHLEHLKEHGEEVYYNQAMEFLKDKDIKIKVEKFELKGIKHGGCMGSKAVDRRHESSSKTNSIVSQNNSELRQWPVQLKLLNPHAPYFKNADLLLTADCVPFTYGNFHQKFLKGKILIMLCPKLDSGIDQYIEKLALILKDNDIRSITIVRMEVPCCFGITKILEESLKRAGKNIIIREYVISINGEII